MDANSLSVDYLLNEVMPDGGSGLRYGAMSRYQKNIAWTVAALAVASAAAGGGYWLWKKHKDGKK
jgi:hypothetical protein